MPEKPTIQFNSKSYKVSQKKGRNLLRVTLPANGRTELLASSLVELQEKANELAQVSRTDTLGWYFEHVWSYTRAHVRPETLNKDAWCFDKFILPRFGYTPLKEIDRVMLQKAFNEWGSTIEPSTLRMVRGKFANILNLALADGMIERNPLKGVRLPEMRGAKQLHLTTDDVYAAINHPSLGFRSMARLLALGLRAGEAAGIKRSDIKKGKGCYIIEVREQRHGRATGPLKNKWSERDIPVPESYGEAILADSGHVYAAITDEGFPPSHAQPWRTAQAVNEKAGAHDFRRVFETVLESEIEAPASVLVALAGRKPKSVAEGYRKPTTETKLKWMARYLEHLSKPQDQILFEERSS